MFCPPVGRCVRQAPVQPTAHVTTWVDAAPGKGWTSVPLEGLSVTSLPFFPLFSLRVLSFWDAMSKLPSQLLYICTHKGTHVHTPTPHAHSYNYSLKWALRVMFQRSSLARKNMILDQVKKRWRVIWKCVEISNHHFVPKTNIML